MVAQKIKDAFQLNLEFENMIGRLVAANYSRNSSKSCQYLNKALLFIETFIIETSLSLLHAHKFIMISIN